MRVGMLSAKICVSHMFVLGEYAAVQVKITYIVSSAGILCAKGVRPSEQVYDRLHAYLIIDH